MFIGEMGCWLVVGLTFLYRRYIAPRLSSDPSPLLAGGYHPVNGQDERLENDDDHTIDGLDTHSRHPKPLHENDERIPLRGWKVLLLAAPSSCDIAGTTLMNVGLLFVAASIYQMTRGALVLFVGLFSVIFLRRKLYLYQWSALFVVVLGVAVVGLSGALFSSDPGHDITQGDGVAGAASHAMIKARAVAGTPEAVKAVIGVLLIAAAQIFTASQFVLEEWILEHYAMDPIQVVGWEGVFGFLVTLVGMVVMYFAVGRTEAGRYGYFDLKEGWRQVTSNRAIAVSSLAIMVSIGYVSPISQPHLEISRALFIIPLSNFIPAASTSSVYQLLAPSLPPPAAQSTPAVPSSSGSSRSAWAGRPSSGSKLSALHSSFTEHSCSMTLFGLLLRPAYLATTENPRSFSPRILLSISD
jgi:drug/metabolite transporter (DMT)-like permease